MIELNIDKVMNLAINKTILIEKKIIINFFALFL